MDDDESRDGDGAKESAPKVRPHLDVIRDVTNGLTRAEARALYELACQLESELRKGIQYVH